MFEDETITMSDFCLRFANLPNDAFFGGNELVLKAMLWTQFLAIMKDDAPEGEFDGTKTKYQILDINFAKTEMKEVKIL